MKSNKLKQRPWEKSTALTTLGGFFIRTHEAVYSASDYDTECNPWYWVLIFCLRNKNKPLKKAVYVCVHDMIWWWCYQYLFTFNYDFIICVVL